MKKLVILDEGKLANSHTLLTGVNRADRFRVQDAWMPLENAHHGQHVDAVNHFGRHEFEMGDVVTILRLDQTPIMTAQVVDMRLLDLDQLTDAEWPQLGYLNRADYDASALGFRRVWAFSFQPVNAQSRDVTGIRQ